MKKYFGIPLIWLLTITIVVAEITIIGLAISNLTVVKIVDFEVMKINEEKTKVLAIVEQPVTDWINLTTTCINKDLISASLTYPIGSSLAGILLNLEGLTIINDPTKNQTINIGNITMTLRALKQSYFNCSISTAVDTNLTNITWVDSI